MTASFESTKALSRVQGLLTIIPFLERDLDHCCCIASVPMNIIRMMADKGINWQGRVVQSSVLLELTARYKPKTRLKASGMQLVMIKVWFTMHNIFF